MKLFCLLLFMSSFQVIAVSNQPLTIQSRDTHKTPAPHGDTRMGADAAESGTDITDQDIQAQEDKKGEIKWDSESPALPVEEEDDLESMQK